MQAIKQVAEKASTAAFGNAKQQQLAEFTRDDTSSTPLTTYWGAKMDKTDVGITAGVRGPGIVNDFHAREKIQNFDHERIPERVVHARGAGAHGVFRLKKSLAEYTTANILTDTSKETPIFVRFSTVAGSRGSADTVRDVRGFAIKFYSDEGIWDMVGNNIPIFFVQDSIQFPDIIHAVKPNPASEIPQAQTAHDNAHDFISLNPASIHMLLWAMSDRTLPRNFATMPGFGVHAFLLINEKGERTFVRYSWKPRVGTHSMIWDECVVLQGTDPDFHRRTLWTQIENGAYPTWDFGVQLVSESQEHSFDFDLLDSTKFWPEEEIPFMVIGELELNRNPDNYFSETEQVAFCTQHILPGMGFSNDPLLVWRNFSYQDTQISRLGGMNFHELPINRPLARCPMGYNHRDGAGRSTILKNQQAYYPNRFGNAHPADPAKENVYQHYPAPVSGMEERRLGPKFNDHFSQATLFYNSLEEVEKEHLVSCLQFELGKCSEQIVQQNSINRINKVDHELALKIAEGFQGITVPDEEIPNHGRRSDYLSLITGKDQVFTAKGRQAGIFVLPGFSKTAVTELKAAFLAAGVVPMIVGPVKGEVDGVATDFTFETCRSVLFDGLVFVGAKDDSTDYTAKMKKTGRIRHALIQGYFHKKPILLHGNTISWAADIALAGEFTDAVKEGSNLKVEKGVIFTPSAGTGVEMSAKFLDLLAHHRVWDRETDHLAV